MKKVLAVIDMQSGFIKECGAESIVPKVADKIKKRVNEGYEVVLTADSAGGQIEQEIAEICRGMKIYEKHTYGCEKLILDLKESQPETVEFVGVCTDICVIVNAIGTMVFLPFSDVVVDGSCCASASEGHRAALQIMKSCKIRVI